MTVILISGKSGSGKDTLAAAMKEILINEHKRPLIIHFADMVKAFARLYYNWNGIKDTSGRELLQKLGTNIVRAYDKNYWARQIAEFIAAESQIDDFDCAIIPDARFPNEIEITKLYNKDTYSVRIERDNYLNPQLTEEQHAHASETALDNYTEFDYIFQLPYNIPDYLEQFKSHASLILKDINLIGETND